MCIRVFLNQILSRAEEIAADPVELYETRASVLERKARVVAMSRDICVSLFDEIIKLRPAWAGTKLTKDGKDLGWNHEDGAIRIVMTGTASDRPGLQDHVYSKGQKKRAEVASFQCSVFREEKTSLAKLDINREAGVAYRLSVVAGALPG
jgi:type I site-specific restriction-modification system R (restriction) subunit